MKLMKDITTDIPGFKKTNTVDNSTPMHLIKKDLVDDRTAT